MAREPRLDWPGAIHHVTIRGVNRGLIFKDDYDRSSFLDRCERIFIQTKMRCFSWALIPNHAHLNVITGTLSVSKVMQRILTGHAIQYNSRHDRSGHLLQARFGSSLVDDTTYLNRVIRYTNLNPIKHGLVENLDELKTFRWSSYMTLMGLREPKLVPVPSVLERFGDTPQVARLNLQEWLRDGLDDTFDDQFQHIGHTSPFNEPKTTYNPQRHTKIIGLERFAEEVFREVETRAQRQERARLAKWSEDDVVEWVCSKLGAHIDELRKGRRFPVVCRARAASAYLLVNDLGHSQTHAATFLGVKANAICNLLPRGEALCNESGIELPALR